MYKSEQIERFTRKYFFTGYDLKIFKHGPTVGAPPADPGYRYSIIGQVYGIDGRMGAGGGNYEAEAYLKKQAGPDTFRVIPYWTRRDGKQIETPFKDGDIKLDSESGQFYAYTNDMEVYKNVVKVFDDYVEQAVT